MTGFLFSNNVNALKKILQCSLLHKKFLKADNLSHMLSAFSLYWLL